MSKEADKATGTVAKRIKKYAQRGITYKCAPASKRHWLTLGRYKVLIDRKVRYGNPLHFSVNDGAYADLFERGVHWMPPGEEREERDFARWARSAEIEEVIEYAAKALEAVVEVPPSRWYVDEAERAERVAGQRVEEARAEHQKARSLLLSVRRQAGELPREGRGTACVRCMPSWLRSAIGEYKDKFPGFEAAMGARGRSREASEAFGNFVFSRYARSMKNTVREVGVINGEPHYGVVVEGWTIDWTARQFDEAAPHPRVVGPEGTEATFDSPDELCDHHWLTTCWLEGYSEGELRLVAERSQDHGERQAADELLSSRKAGREVR